MAVGAKIAKTADRKKVMDTTKSRLPVFEEFSDFRESRCLPALTVSYLQSPRSNATTAPSQPGSDRRGRCEAKAVGGQPERFHALMALPETEQ